VSNTNFVLDKSGVSFINSFCECNSENRYRIFLMKAHIKIMGTKELKSKMKISRHPQMEKPDLLP